MQFFVQNHHFQAFFLKENPLKTFGEQKMRFLTNNMDFTAKNGVMIPNFWVLRVRYLSYWVEISFG